MNLWQWAIEQREAVDNPPPERIHSQSGDREDWGQAREGIRGLPFTAAFERYVSGAASVAPIELALMALHSPRDRVQSLEFEVAWAVIKGGHSDKETLRAILGCTEPAFTAAADRGLAIIREKTLLLISERQKRNEVTLKAGLAVDVA